MLKKLGFVVLAGWVAALGAPREVAATCTASQTCSNACGAFLECPTGIVLTCSAPNEVVTCSGATTCTVGAAAVTCDGVTRTCEPKSTRCRTGSDSIRCGSTFKACPTCGGRVCQVAPQPQPGLEAPATADTTATATGAAD